VDTQERIKQQIASDKIVLYMKGSPQFPQCGFSAKATQLLNACGAKFASYDVLSDPDIRQGIKQHSNWPTIPQLYVNGEFVGGCDIMTELYQKGELQKLVAKAQG
jgi:monothiol glutaredoxin